MGVRKPYLMTRRLYLTIKAMQYGAGMFPAIEAVASTAIEHPEWQLDEEQTWDEWHLDEEKTWDEWEHGGNS